VPSKYAAPKILGGFLAGISQMAPNKRPIDSNVAAWDGVLQAYRRVPVLSAAP